MDLSFIQSILRRVGIRHLPGICWYPAKRTSFIVNSRWHRGQLRLFVLDRTKILSRTFFSEQRDTMFVCKSACSHASLRTNIGLHNMKRELQQRKLRRSLEKANSSLYVGHLFTVEHWTVQHKARIVAAQAAQKPRRGEFELVCWTFCSHKHKIWR